MLVKKILTANSAFEVVTGYKCDEVVGLSPTILQSGLHDDSFYKNMWATIDDHGEWEGEIWNKRKNGELYPEGITVFSFKDPSGEITNYYAILAYSKENGHSGFSFYFDDLNIDVKRCYC